MSKKIFLIVFCLFFLTDFSPAICHARNKVDAFLEYLGNPYLKYYPNNNKIYARNIWDMVGFRGKLYLGAGNSSNYGPSPNAGPVPIIAYAPPTNSFTTVFVTSEEQVDAFYVIENQLLVPGHDPRESWEYGNLYLSTDGVNWQKKRTIPNAVHTYCLYFYDNKLFAGLGTPKGASVAISENMGDSWQTSLFQQIGRFYDLPVVAGRLYAVGAIQDNAARLAFEAQIGRQIDEIFEYGEKGIFSTRRDITSRELFPDTALAKNRVYKIIKSITFKNKAIYLGCYIHNDHQYIPFGLYIADSLSPQHIAVQKIVLPDNTLPWDTFLSQGYIYVLLNRPLPDGTTEVSVLRSNDLKRWNELFYFSAPTMVRSFALLKGFFYFSLGCEVADPSSWKPEDLSPETGEIFRLDGHPFSNIPGGFQVDSAK